MKVLAAGAAAAKRAAGFRQAGGENGAMDENTMRAQQLPHRTPKADIGSRCGGFAG